nr:DUF2642 domain-containing protein [Neobacillus sp. Marseille-Q6967]
MGSDNFSSTLDSLIGYQVNLYVGEEIIKGKLMGVEPDHIIIEDEFKYVFYYNIDKVQAITKNTKQFKSENITTEFLKTQSLRELLTSLKNTWVTILCVNKQTFSGVLSLVDLDFATLISGEERILVKISHISNVLKGFKKEEKAESNKNDNGSESNDEKVEQSKSETSVVVNENKKASQKDKMKKVEKETAKIVIPEKEKDFKIWSEPVKADEKIVTSSQKPKANPVSNGTNEVKQSKQEMKPIIETKAQKSEVVHKINKQEKEVISPAPFVAREKKSPAKEVQKELKPVKMETMSQKDKNADEMPAKVKKVQETIETSPLMKIGSSRRSSKVAKETVVKPQTQEVAASRFAGEPTPQHGDFDRRSIFSGWPSRKNMPRRF